MWSIRPSEIEIFVNRPVSSTFSIYAAAGANLNTQQTGLDFIEIWLSIPDRSRCCFIVWRLIKLVGVDRVDHPENKFVIYRECPCLILLYAASPGCVGVSRDRLWYSINITPYIKTDQPPRLSEGLYNNSFLPFIVLNKSLESLKLKTHFNVSIENYRRFGHWNAVTLEVKGNKIKFLHRLNMSTRNGYRCPELFIESSIIDFN